MDVMEQLIYRDSCDVCCKIGESIDSIDSPKYTSWEFQFTVRQVTLNSRNNSIIYGERNFKS